MKRTWTDALKLCNEIIDICEDLPEEADEFASSVIEKCSDMHDWIRENRHVTKKQLESLDNMLGGVRAWER